MQGHAVFVVAPEGSMILPGVVEEKGVNGRSKGEDEKMKIAWRYERLGAFEGRERGKNEILFDPKNSRYHDFVSSMLRSSYFGRFIT